MNMVNFERIEQAKVGCTIKTYCIECEVYEVDRKNVYCKFDYKGKERKIIFPKCVIGNPHYPLQISE